MKTIQTRHGEATLLWVAQDENGQMQIALCLKENEMPYIGEFIGE